MSITDELREWMENAYTYGPFVGGEFPKKYAAPWFGWKPAIVELLDRIDERHERDLRESYDCGYASADDWLAQHEDAMAEHGWIRLPLDADGVPIRVGDRLEHVNGAFTANDLTISIDGLWRAWDGENGYTVLLAKCRHHHAPTVEDVLYESLRHFGAVEERTPEVEEWLHKQAAKLRLAEGVDE